MKSFKIGIIGFGNAARAHITALRAIATAKVTAVYSSRTLDPAEVETACGGPVAVFSDLAKLLASDIDAVTICSYPHLHAEHVMAAAQAGKHLILEKPISLNWDDARRMDAAVQAAGVGVCVCFELRFSNQLRVTKSLIDSGMLGTLHYGEVDYYHGIGPWSKQWRWNTRRDSGGSSLLSAGCHALNALMLCMGGRVKAVTSAQTRSRSKLFQEYEYATTSVTLLHFDDGRIGKVASLIDCVQPYYLHFHLVGSKGSLLDDKFHSSRIEHLERHQWSHLAMKKADSGDVHDHPYQAQFEQFFASLAQGGDMPLTGWAESLESHRVILAADLSAEERRTVNVEELS